MPIKSRDGQGGLLLRKLFTCWLLTHFAMLCKNKKKNEQVGMSIVWFLGEF